MIVCLTDGINTKGTFYVRAAGSSINCGENFLLAVDVWIKFIKIFESEFHESLENFLNFICSCVLEMETANETSKNFKKILDDIIIYNETRIQITTSEEISENTVDQKKLDFEEEIFN